VLIESGLDDLGNWAVVAEVDDLGATSLKKAAYDIDRGVVPVEERARGDQPDAVVRSLHALPSMREHVHDSIGRTRAHDPDWLQAVSCGERQLGFGALAWRSLPISDSEKPFGGP